MPEIANDGGVAGTIRVQFLSPTLVRIEKRGPKGFEDRKTFTVQSRLAPLIDVQVSKSGRSTQFRCGELTVEVPRPDSLKGIRVLRGGEECYRYEKPFKEPAFFPGPSDFPKSIAIADAPRIVPPRWGAALPPDGVTPKGPSLGWDLANQAEDIYVFLPQSYSQFRREFLELTGPVEMPPLYYFGFWHSRYHPYTDKEALSVIDKYRRSDIPLDGFVVDTDWRVGASHGYETNTKLFPDMAWFIKEAHDRNVRLMYNDQPEPFTKGALERAELEFRTKGLASLLNMGVDVWWYDRNWSTHLSEPAPGLRKEVWGAALFHDITQQVRPDMRPLIMSNVPGIDNGRRSYAPHPAAHRYPAWWTGDTTGNWDFLKSGIANAVDAGVESMLPYLSEDLGGHFGNPTPEVYTRFVQYGALSPMMRVHCTAGEIRDPWEFGPQVQAIVRDYTKLRYRLLPTLYAAARRNYEDGTPLLRRCDLEWPEEPGANRSDQYLLGDDLLVAPIVSTGQTEPKVIPTALLRTSGGKPGLNAEYFANKDLKGRPEISKIDTGVDFNWGFGSPDKALPNGGFSIRWTGSVGPAPESGEYVFSTRMDDGVRLWLGGKLVIDEWHANHLPRSVGINLAKGESLNLRLEYYNDGLEASAQLSWIKPSDPRLTRAKRDVWIPPGEWIDLGTGKSVQGPRNVEVACSLQQTPMWVRAGGLVLLAPEMSFSSERPWSPVTLEAFPREGEVSTRTLYEDDGQTTGYQRGKFRKTLVRLEQKNREVTVSVGDSKGSYVGMPEMRRWKVRLHVPIQAANPVVMLDGQPALFRVLASEEPVNYMPLLGSGGCPSSSVIEVAIPEAPGSKPRELKVRFD